MKVSNPLAGLNVPTQVFLYLVIAWCLVGLVVVPMLHMVGLAPAVRP